MTDMKKRPENDAACASPEEELRRQAEIIALKNASRSQESLAALSPEETRQMLHELQVHQIEMEMQNEELRRVQVELRIVQARYFDLYDLAPVGYCTLGEDGLILQSNLAAAALLGVARSELVNQLLTPFILWKDQDIYYLFRKKLFESIEAQSCELRMVRHDGTQFWAHLAGSVAQIEDAPVLHLVLSDITGRKHAESALRESNEKFYAMSASAQDAIVMIDNDGNISFWNAAAETIFGYLAQEVMGQNLHALITPERFQEAHRKGFEHFRQSGEGAAIGKTLKLSALRKGGAEFPIELSLSVVKMSGLWCAVGVMRDITERVQAEETLKASEARFKTMFNEAPLGIALIDSLTGHIHSINPMFAKIAVEPWKK